MTQTPSASDIITFWRDAGYDKWFKKDEAFDAEIRRRFEGAHMAAAARNLDSWMETAEGALALLLLLDQFPRNMYRDTAHAFATDPLARSFARRAVAAGHDQAVEPAMRAFFHLPYEHSENLGDQEEGVRLMADDAEQVKWAILHRDIIQRFGRFPHRNAALGRDTTPDEQAFLDSGGFAG